MRNDDPVSRAILRIMAEELVREVGPNIAFALFVDWHDGEPLSYLSNAARSDVVKELRGWLARTANVADLGGDTPGGGTLPDLHALCARLVHDMVEEDVGAFLFLFRNGSAEDGGGSAWVCSIPFGRRLIEKWVETEMSRP